MTRVELAAWLEHVIEIAEGSPDSGEYTDEIQNLRDCREMLSGMHISDRRVVEFRQWAEQRFQIGSGPYPEGEDLLLVVMSKVENLLFDRSVGYASSRMAAKILGEALTTIGDAPAPANDPIPDKYLDWMRDAVDEAAHD
jgi:hypothetical protein